MRVTQIEFAGGFHQAILTGRKTQTRRPVKGDAGYCRYGGVGDILLCELSGRDKALRITAVRVERISELTLQDARKEGFLPLYSLAMDEVDAFRFMWDAFYGTRSWEQREWVWVIEFELEHEELLTYHRKIEYAIALIKRARELGACVERHACFSHAIELLESAWAELPVR